MSKCFDTVIILGGVHFDQVFRSRENKIRAFIHQTNLILEQNHNIYSFETRCAHCCYVSRYIYLFIMEGSLRLVPLYVGNVYSTSGSTIHFQLETKGKTVYSN